MSGFNLNKEDSKAIDIFVVHEDHKKAFERHMALPVTEDSRGGFAISFKGTPVEFYQNDIRIIARSFQLIAEGKAVMSAMKDLNFFK